MKDLRIYARNIYISISRPLNSVVQCCRILNNVGFYADARYVDLG